MTLSYHHHHSTSLNPISAPSKCLTPIRTQPPPAAELPSPHLPFPNAARPRMSMNRHHNDNKQCPWCLNSPNNASKVSFGLQYVFFLLNLFKCTNNYSTSTSRTWWSMVWQPPPITHKWWQQQQQWCQTMTMNDDNNDAKQQPKWHLWGIIWASVILLWFYFKRNKSQVFDLCKYGSTRKYDFLFIKFSLHLVKSVYSLLIDLGFTSNQQSPTDFKSINQSINEVQLTSTKISINQWSPTDFK